ncbi:hypothetical protein EG329_013655 [Mollisiaceae sp. DMI_Dod_QoI]|nr:hypothetical protein EG329_013655 [Helotiales sp. DMI_Dod_QoI]
MASAHQDNPHRSNSPLPQQQQIQTKRDKRRGQLMDRLRDMTEAFSANRDLHYREQLQAIQVDMNLITRADLYGESLPDKPENIDKMVEDEVRVMSMKGMSDRIPLRAGKIFADFVEDVYDAKEERDSTLTQHERNFEVKMAEVVAHHAYKRKLAASEHKALSDTMRDRLINSVTSKKARLSKDKEALEINNDNAYLLHPSQFGLANPASPGGIHGKRATRHRRDADELPNFAETHKRKRKAQDSDESPAPSRQRLDNGTSTPTWQAEKLHNIAVQFDSPLYSIDKLFTEKELSMTYNTAALAAYSYMIRPTQSADDVESPPNGKSDSSSDNDKAPAAAADGDADDAESPPGGTGMERQYSHATRSTRGAYLQTGLGYEVFPDINYPGTLDALSKHIPKLPPMINSLGSRNFSSRTDAAATVAGLSQEDAAAEIDLIRRARAYNDEHGPGANLGLEVGAKRVLEEAAFPKTYQKLLSRFTAQRDYSYIIPSDAKGALYSNKSQNIPTSSVRDELGGHEMAPQLSQGSMGGTPMSRQATDDSITKSKSGRAIKRRGD